MKKHYRKSRINLPPLVEPDIHLYGTGKRASIRAFLLRFARRQYEKPNSEKIESYLRQCALDPTVGRSSLFRDFLTRQRPEDKTLPRESIDNYYQHVDQQEELGQSQERPQQQQRRRQHYEQSTSDMDISTTSTISSNRNNRDHSSMSIIEVPDNNNNHVGNNNNNNNNYNYNYDCNTPPSSSVIVTIPAPVLAPTSDDDAMVPASPIASISMEEEEESPHPTSSMSQYVSTTSDESVIQSIPPPTIHDYKFLKVLGKGCMGKVNIFSLTII